jgi:hypothetical protein
MRRGAEGGVLYAADEFFHEKQRFEFCRRHKAPQTGENHANLALYLKCV